METTNLKIVYNRENRHDSNIQNRINQLVKRFEIRVRKWYKELEQLGSAAGIAIRN